MARSPKSIRHLLQDKPTLRSIDHEISAQQALLIMVRQCLPGDMASHCVAAQVREQRLVLHTDSPVWATRLRYLSTELLSAMKCAEPTLREIKIKLLVEGVSTPKRHTAAHKSDLAAAIIHDCANFTKETPLREALERLSLALKHD